MEKESEDGKVTNPWTFSKHFQMLYKEKYGMRKEGTDSQSDQSSPDTTTENEDSDHSSACALQIQPVEDPTTTSLSLKPSTTTFTKSPTMVPSVPTV